MGQSCADVRRSRIEHVDVKVTQVQVLPSLHQECSRWQIDCERRFSRAGPLGGQVAP